MKLSTKCRYGARAIIEIAKFYNNGYIKRKDIVKNQEIPDSYLENILVTLKNAGLIVTVRGSSGGYALSKPPSEISLLDIVRALEGNHVIVDCLSNPLLCNRIDTCATRGVWKKLQESKESILDSVTLQKIIDDENERKDSEQFTSFKSDLL